MTDKTKMSIRLWSDGHSFPTTHSTMDPTKVVVEFLSPKTTLVPADLYQEEQAAEYLSLAGMPCSKEEIAIRTSPQEGCVAVMAINRALREQLPEQATFTSPLLPTESPTTPTAILEQHGNLLYIQLWNPSLQLAEVLPIQQQEEILYYLARLAQLFPLKGMKLQCRGEEPKRLRKVAQTYFQ
ncbi:MAG: DUF3822 family protein [Alistipes sp.]|nr:DUF3822 family protein [Alistipes sp.]